jgi:hypothetical protein
MLLASIGIGQTPPPAEAPSATFSLDKDREQIVMMDGLWRFHPGDDPRWADPGFSDSSWPLISSDKGWSPQGYKNMGGMGWYRIKVQIPGGNEPLSLYVPLVETCYEVFADGKLIGTFGGMPPHEEAVFPMPEAYDLPKATTDHAHPLLIALRIWHWPYWASFESGGIHRGIEIGQSHLIQRRLAAQVNTAILHSVSQLFLCVLKTLAGLAALVFFVIRKQEREYLWFGLMMLLDGAGSGAGFYYQSHHIAGINRSDSIGIALQTVSGLAAIAFYFRLLHGKRDWLLWFAIGSIAASPCIQVARQLVLISAAQSQVLRGLAYIPFAIWILNLLIRRAFQGLPDARLLLAPVLLQQLSSRTYDVLVAIYQAGWGYIPWGWLIITWQSPFPFSLFDVIDALFLIAMLAILIHRFTRTRMQEERFANEFEAARTIQQVLVPETIPTIPGFTIQSVYKPFGEVGGDFFQIIPTPSDGILGVIGDVSGKGMPAAMTVSLLVGTVRTLAHYTHGPGEILAAMNQRMLARSQGGFTTCLVFRADVDGRLTVANAGHLAPYLNGTELSVQNGLPLGLDAGSTYLESTFRLSYGDQLTLMSDGVVEARNKTRELYGFDRAAQIAKDSAESIARAAQEFGQEDDITIVTLSRASVAKSVGVELPTPSLSSLPGT